jgi:hypothetical protein
MEIDNANSNFVLENSNDLIKVTIQGQKQWRWLFPSLFIFLANGLCLLPIFGLILIGMAQKYLTGILQWVIPTIILGLFLFILYKKFLDVETFFDRETVEIREQSITIEKAGLLRFKTRKVFAAEDIKGLTASSPIREQFNLLNFLPFASSSLGAFMIWTNHWLKPFYNFGRGVSQPDAQNLLNTVYRMFPNYRNIQIGTRQ